MSDPLLNVTSKCVQVTEPTKAALRFYRMRFFFVLSVFARYCFASFSVAKKDALNLALLLISESRSK